MALEYSKDVDRIVSRFKMGPHEIGAFCITRYTLVGPPSSDATNMRIYIIHRTMKAGGDSLLNPS